MAVHSWRYRLWRRLIAVSLAAAVALSPLTCAYASEDGRRAVLVIDANTGRVIYQRSADQPRFPASLAKLMTLYLLFEQIEQGRLSLTSSIRFSANAAAQPASNLEVDEGAEIAVGDAIKALIVKSANDVAVAVAERIAGSQEKFAELMNRKARELGMTGTEFHNASGLPDPEQVTTARDMVTLALRLHDQFPKYYPLFATRTFTWGSETFRNHNTLLFRYEGLEGMKTGYIRASGFNLVASARRGRKHVMAAYFGGQTAALRNAAVRAHLDAAFAKASEKKTRHPGPLPVALARAPAPAPAPATSAQPASAQPRPAPAPPGTELARAAPPEANVTPPDPEAPPVPVAAVPNPQAASRSPLAAVPGVEVVRVRPVLAEGTTVVSEGSGRPANIDDLLKQPEPRPSAPAQDAAPREAASAPAPKAAVVPEPAAPAGPFQVQVGAYQTPGEAERQLALVRERAGSLLGRHTPHMSQVKRGDKVYFRARYVGFDGRSAADNACSELKRLEIACLVMRAE
jgi:D-alanyl-D-alanine carboxypeptidase